MTYSYVIFSNMTISPPPTSTDCPTDFSLVLVQKSDETSPPELFEEIDPATLVGTGTYRMFTNDTDIFSEQPLEWEW